MEFQHFLSIIPKIKGILNEVNYNARAFQVKMIPHERLHFDKSSIKNAKEAGVLILCYPKNNETHFSLTLRATYKGTHSGQISFPGGKKEAKDDSLLQTALRETEEEIGICANKVINRIAFSKIYIPPSNFWVSPFLGIANEEPIFQPNYEVEKIIEVSIKDLLDETKITERAFYNKEHFPCFNFKGHIVWGATAIILSELKGIIEKIKLESL